MKKLLGSLIVLAAMALPALAQAQQQMSPDDQQKFDNYYSRWSQDRQSGDRDDMVSSEHHMQDLMNKYSIPADTPYDQIASQNNMAPPPPPAPGYDYRGYNNNPAYNNQGYNNQMSPDDQNKFNKEYSKWQQANAKNDRDDIDKHARNMEELMQRNNIPQNTPFNAIATTTGGYAPRVDVRQYQGRFSPDDQKKYDKAYEKFQRDHAKHDRDDYAKDEMKLNEIMAKYNIPRDVPYDALASGNRGY